jgi:hypothetical protein
MNQNYSLAELGITKKPKVFKGEISKNPFEYLLYITTYIQYIYTYIIYNSTTTHLVSTGRVHCFFFMTLLNRRGVYIL